MEFTEFRLDKRIMSGVSKAGFVTPTPVQAQAIPPALEGRDIIGLAQTGTGKTAAFILPILNRLIRGRSRRPRALIIAPTRELAEQIHDTARSLGKNTGLRSVSVYGGVNIRPQIEKIRSGVDIVVACPGRLLDHIGQGTINLSGLEVLVLDEADRMFDMGFIKDIRRIIGYMPLKRQTMLFSATMPDDIRQLAGEVLTDPVAVQIDHTKPLETVAHALYPVCQHLKTGLLRALIKNINSGSVLVFTRTKHRARRVGEILQRDGFRAASLQGNLSQNKRQETLDGFRNGRYQILVATDIAARGLDVSTISHVINYDMPNTSDAYTHRIGRTGRAAKSGDAFTFVTGADKEMVMNIERVIGERVERRLLKGFDYSAKPACDSEFVREPRGHQGRRPHAKNKASGSSTVAPAGTGTGRTATARRRVSFCKSFGPPARVSNKW